MSHNSRTARQDEKPSHRRLLGGRDRETGQDWGKDGGGQTHREVLGERVKRRRLGCFRARGHREIKNEPKSVANDSIIAVTRVKLCNFPVILYHCGEYDTRRESLHKIRRPFIGHSKDSAPISCYQAVVLRFIMLNYKWLNSTVILFSAVI